jgi:RHS repeat-associated protein
MGLRPDPYQAGDHGRLWRGDPCSGGDRQDGVAIGEGSAQPFGYAGEVRDAETGLVYLRARMYDPATGRFLSRDPFPGLATSPMSQNPYAYAHNNPVNLTDPSGMNPAVGAAAVACLANPACVIVVGATGTYLWWTHGGREATTQLLEGISTWFAEQKGPELRGKDTRAREQAKIREMTRDMTPEQARRFHDEVGKRKRSVGGGGAHNLDDDELEEVRDHILGGGY